MQLRVELDWICLCLDKFSPQKHTDPVQILKRSYFFFALIMSAISFQLFCFQLILLTHYGRESSLKLQWLDVLFMFNVFRTKIGIIVFYLIKPSLHQFIYSLLLLFLLFLLNMSKCAKYFINSSLITNK